MQRLLFYGKLSLGLGSALQQGLDRACGHETLRLGNEGVVQPQLIATGDSQFGQHLLVMGEHLQTAVHDLAKVCIGVQQALGVLDVVITRVGKGGIGLRQPEIPHIEQLILVVNIKRLRRYSLFQTTLK